MVTVVLKQGESVRVEVADGDGSFDVAYTHSELTISAEFPGSHLGGEGLIYREVFGGCTCAEVADIPGKSSLDERCPEHGDLAPAAEVAT